MNFISELRKELTENDFCRNEILRVLFSKEILQNWMKGEARSHTYMQFIFSYSDLHVLFFYCV